MLFTITDGPLTRAMLMLSTMMASCFAKAMEFHNTNHLLFTISNFSRIRATLPLSTVMASHFSALAGQCS
jgi:hypothetical protein